MFLCHFVALCWGFSPFQAHLCLQALQRFACKVQIHQRKQRVQLRRVFLQPFVAHLAVAKLAFEHAKGVLNFGPDFGLGFLEVFYRAFYGVLFIERFALAWLRFQRLYVLKSFRGKRKALIFYRTMPAPQAAS